MKEFKIGDQVRVVAESKGRYVGEVDTIESVHPDRGWLLDSSLDEPAFYLKGCHLKFAGGDRLYFLESELELVKEFYWKKKSDNERI